MRRVLPVLVLLLFSASASADMIEIKDRGILNGKIVSQDDQQVQFKTTDGELHTVARPDVLFLEAQTDAPPPSAGDKVGSFFDKWRRKAVRAFRDARNGLKKWTDKGRRMMSSPIDRSDADGKAKMLSDTMHESTDNTRKLARRERQIADNKKIAKGYSTSAYGGDQKKNAPKYSVRKDALLGS